MSNFGLTAVEAVGLAMPDNFNNDPVTKAVYDNIMGNIPTKKPKVTVYCSVCSLEFSSQVVLDTHLAGSKHQRKLKSKELMKNLEETESGFERNTISGVIRCTICDVTVNSPQLLATHVAGNKHKSKKGKRENGEEGGTPAKKLCSGATGQSNGKGITPTGSEATDSTTPQPKKKERAPLQLNIPACVTKLEETKAGGKFLCNPCQAHCNSDIQLSQHLSSKKHLEKGNFACYICDMQFSSKPVLSAHLAGIKHERKVKSDEIMKILEQTEPSVGRDPSTGELRCNLCNVTAKAAHVLKKHVSSREHRFMKGENVTEEDEENAEGITGANGDSTSISAPPKKKERPRLAINVPSCVSKLEETKAGGKYICNPCQAHCNSDIQLSQHLTCKKHLDKVSGKKKTPAVTWRSWKGGLYGKGRAGTSQKWDSLSASSALLISTISSSYNNQASYADSGFASNYTDSYGLSSLGRSSASDYSVSKAGGAGRGGGGRGGGAAYGRNDAYSRPDGGYGRGTAAAYGKPEAYARSEYGVDYSAGKANDYSAYSRANAAYSNHQGYGVGQSGGHAAGRGVYTYTQPLSQNFVSGGKIV